MIVWPRTSIRVFHGTVGKILCSLATKELFRSTAGNAWSDGGGRGKCHCKFRTLSYQLLLQSLNVLKNIIFVESFNEDLV